MASYRQPGTVVTDRTFTVPLDHSDPNGVQIELFARQVIAAEHADDGTAGRLPWLLFLQGGPGLGGPRPLGRDSWLNRALRDYRVLLLDQRGTGRSTPANRQTLAALGTARAQADYLCRFRADSIVRDAELVRMQIAGGEPWAVLGQSFGGFCAVSYLSIAPAGIREAFITGGLPGLDAAADDVYRRTYRVVAQKNDEHYDRYPQDTKRAADIARVLSARPASLPDGAVLTVEGFQALGRHLGMSAGSHSLHYLLETALTAPDAGQLSDDFLYRVQSQLSFASAPLYALLQEASYAQGTATRWAAQRLRAALPRFDASTALAGGDPLLFTGEMIYPWMFETDPVLRPLAEAAHLLAERPDWPPLYDPLILEQNEVPAFAAIYYNDMYVPVELSVQTAARIRGLCTWVTSEYEHDGLRVSSGAVLDRLIRMARGEV